ncbi:MAG TPA: hypothetical protein VIJ35_25300 [Bradyrhizobium sp.]|jgi:hypothetical protein
MTNETTKALLMIWLLGSIVAATYVPEFLVRAMAVVWSAMALPDRALQHIFLKRVPSSGNPASAQAGYRLAA